MKTLKRLIFFALAALMLASLCGCGGKLPDTADAAKLAAAVDGAIDGDGRLIAVDDTYAKLSMQMDVSDCESWVAKINAYGVNVDEYGVFKGADEETAKAIAEKVEAYLAWRDETWMPEYMPEERPKLQQAECRTLGCYVMYAILSDDAKTAAFDAFEAAVKEG